MLVSQIHTDQLTKEHIHKLLYANMDDDGKQGIVSLYSEAAMPSPTGFPKPSSCTSRDAPIKSCSQVVYSTPLRPRR